MPDYLYLPEISKKWRKTQGQKNTEVVSNKKWFNAVKNAINYGK